MKKILILIFVFCIAYNLNAQTTDKRKYFTGMHVVDSSSEYFSFTADSSKAYSNMEIVKNNNIDSIYQIIDGVILVDKLLNKIDYCYEIIVHTGMSAELMYNNLKTVIYNKPGTSSIETVDGYKVTIKEKDRTYLILFKNNRFKMTLHSSSDIYNTDYVLTLIGLDKFFFANYILHICKAHDSSFDF